MAKKTKKYFISDECVGCRGCRDECPVEAIVENGEKFVVNEEACIGCGKCADICPMAIPVLKEE